MDKDDSFSLDPQDWSALRTYGHRMLDDLFDHMQTLDERPVWQKPTAATRAAFQQMLPREAGSLEAAHARFVQDIAPYSVGNAHPRFMGWVQGGGNAVGMLAEMLAAGLNANLGGRDQIPMEVERQIVAWMRELFQFPPTANGVLVTGTSMANLMAVLVARTHALGVSVRDDGLAAYGGKLVGYASVAAHGCVVQAMDLAGLGRTQLRAIPVDNDFRINLIALEQAIRADREAGLQPFFMVGNAGTVDTGAIDDLTALANIAQREKLWFHIDGAYGALGMMSQTLATRLLGIERADSIAFDFHKWGQVPYDAGFLLVRDGQKQLDTFAAPVAYLRRETRGLAANSPWPCDLGPDLSRSFRALKTWFTLSVYGTDRLGRVMDETCRLARYLETKVTGMPELEMMLPVSLNIVCFRFRDCDADTDPDLFNRELVADVQESGEAVPSTTTLNGKIVIRVAIVNHRTTERDIDRMLAAVMHCARLRKNLRKNNRGSID